MADVNRYKFGETNPVQAPWVSGHAVYTGDCVYLDNNGNVRSASDLAWDTNAATTQADFVGGKSGVSLGFLGVAAQRYDGVNGNAYGIADGNLRVDTQGVFEFDTTDASHNVGDLVGLAANGTTNLYSQQVTTVTSATQAIGRVAEAAYTQYGSVNRVKVRLMTQLQQVDH